MLTSQAYVFLQLDVEEAGLFGDEFLVTGAGATSGMRIASAVSSRHLLHDEHTPRSSRHLLQTPTAALLPSGCVLIEPLDNTQSTEGM